MVTSKTYGKTLPGWAEHLIWDFEHPVEDATVKAHNPLPEPLEPIKPCDTLQDRCQVMAAILGVSSMEITKYISSLLRKLPSPNKGNHQDDCQQDIFAGLLRRKDAITGNWQLVKLEISSEFTEWWGNYLTQRDISVNWSISLDHRDDSQDDAVDLADIIADHQDCFGEADEGMLVTSILEYLPPTIAMIVGKRLALGVKNTKAEGMRLGRWLKLGDNCDHLRGLVDGTWTGKTTWIMPMRPGKPRKLVANS